MKPIKVILIFSLFIGMSACQKDEPGVQKEVEVRPLTAQEDVAAKAANDFSFEIFKKLSDKEDQNIFISPLSISMALGMTYNGADGSTKEAIQNVLGFKSLSPDDVNNAYRGLKDLLTGIDNKIDMKIANSIWNRNTLTLQKDFVDNNKKFYDAVVQGLNFGDSRSKDVINNWVKDITHGKIDEMVDQINPDHAMFLLNAIYFKGDWKYKFDKSKTYEGDFHKSNGGIAKTDFMVLDKGKYFRYYDEQKTLIDLPYGNGQFSMTFIMPENGNLNTILNNLDSKSLKACLDKADSSKLELHLPKFKMKYEKSLVEVLTQLGMGEAFTGKANFTKMIVNAENLAISDVKHKTFLEVNEVGTEAAASTAVDIIFTSLPPKIYINKPFVFLIREKSTNAILFIGKYVAP